MADPLVPPKGPSKGPLGGQEGIGAQAVIVQLLLSCCSCPGSFRPPRLSLGA